MRKGSGAALAREMETEGRSRFVFDVLIGAGVPSRHATLRCLGKQGRLAQLGEHQLDKLGVTGSSPVPPILTIGLVDPRRVFLAVGCPFLVQLGQHKRF